MILKFLNGKESITDLDWSPMSPTLLTCITLDGRILVWDLSQSVLDPIITHTVLDQHLLSCLFAPQTPVLVTGDENGSVNVYKLRKVKWYNSEAENRKVNSGQKLYSEELMKIFSPLLIREHQVRDLKEHK
ncbi:WD repeat-containing protein 78 [Coelomomyces lativittatus]|nr:WD repeat-containing protein 78 [Coelomomyces lativittatus]